MKPISLVATLFFAFHVGLSIAPALAQDSNPPGADWTAESSDPITLGWMQGFPALRCLTKQRTRSVATLVAE